MMSGPRGPYAWGYTHATMAGNSGSQLREQELIP